jgi:hypothetical protein
MKARGPTARPWALPNQGVAVQAADRVQSASTMVVVVDIELVLGDTAPVGGLIDQASENPPPRATHRSNATPTMPSLSVDLAGAGRKTKGSLVPETRSD